MPMIRKKKIRTKNFVRLDRLVGQTLLLLWQIPLVSVHHTAQSTLQSCDARLPRSRQLSERGEKVAVSESSQPHAQATMMHGSLNSYKTNEYTYYNRRGFIFLVHFYSRAALLSLRIKPRPSEDQHYALKWSQSA